MLNEALKQVRLFHQLTQVQLATELRISKSYICEIEANKKAVSMDILQKYASYFSIPASSLLLLSENLDAVKKSDKLRLACAKKIIKLMEWINARQDVDNSET